VGVRGPFEQVSITNEKRMADVLTSEGRIPVKLGLSELALAAVLSGIFGACITAQAQQPAVPDAPVPQPHQPLSGTNGTPITPGKGAGTEQTGPSSSSTTNTEEPAPEQPAPPPARDEVQTAPPDQPAPGEGMSTLAKYIVDVNFVEVPVTVKDSKGHLVSGLTYRDFQVYENNAREPLRLFTVDSAPLSIAFVIDQSLTSDVMAKVNNSLDAIQGALTPYDEIAIFTYANGPQERTGFTGAQSARVPFVLSMTKSAGADMLVPNNGGGPLSANCSVVKNGNCVDPNVQYGGATGNPDFITIPKEIHTLNDAILRAAKELSTRPKGRRRIIYVISDGKEYGSKATYKEVLKYLQTNKIAVYGTAVGDSARWGEGYISRLHIPFTMYDNRLASYVLATGGTLDSENGLNGIEKSYARIAEEARNQYTLGYLSHESIYDDKYRSLDVRVLRPGLEVIAKKGYWPSAQDTK
jgi:VWFA-related protein